MHKHMNQFKLIAPKITGFVLLSLFSVSLVLTGCEKVQSTMNQEDYQLTPEGETTKHIQAGASLQEFLSAYEGYELLEYRGDGSCQVFHPEDYLDESNTLTIDTISLILPTFFVDEVGMNADELCSTYNIEKENLLRFLNEEDFLKEHTVSYRILLFEFQEGVLQNIIPSYHNYEDKE